MKSFTLKFTPCLAFCMLFAFIVLGKAHGQLKISGFVKDSKTGERLIGASIQEKGTAKGTVSDNHGYFSLPARPGATISCSYVGYNVKAFQVNKDTMVSILLAPGKKLEEVVVYYRPLPKINTSSLSKQELLALPSLGAKPDVIKSLQLLPGLQPAREGSAQLLVRGGDPGQNQYLFDEVPILYVNHLGGFTSVFNPDMISHVEVYKGAYPARHGGKLSSVVDIAQREGDTSGVKASLGIGLSDASFTIEGPLKGKNTSFILTGRKTMTDPLLALASFLSDGGGYIISYGFHDVNGKVTWKPNLKNSFSLNAYQGDDYLNYWSGMGTAETSRLSNTWGNWLVSARWNQLVSDRLFARHIISYSRYRLARKTRYSIQDTASADQLFEQRGLELYLFTYYPPIRWHQCRKRIYLCIRPPA